MKTMMRSALAVALLGGAALIVTPASAQLGRAGGAVGGTVGGLGSSAGGMAGGMREMDYLQAQNQLKTFASMTGGMSFSPLFQGALPDVFAQINDSIRNQYILTYRPTNNKSDGSYRKVKVLLVDNEGHPLRMQDEKGKPQKYSIIARDGYKAKQQVE